jgi:hypothetical protein
MARKRVIEAKDIVNDIRSGLSEAELMEKYNLSSKGLQSAFQKLIKGGIMMAEEVYGRYQAGADTVTVRNMRSFPRYTLAVAVSIFDLARPKHPGRLRSITERGIGITGIKATVGEIKSFVIPCRDYLEAEQISLEAECRWMIADEKDRWVGGFQITKISKEDLDLLRELIKLAVLQRL